MERYRRELKALLTSRYVLCLLVIALIGYGQGIFHETLDIDDLRLDYYVGAEGVFWRSGRFGMILWAALLRVDDFYPGVDQMIGVLLMMAAAVHFCILFQRCAGEKWTVRMSYIFSAFFLSYPLIHEAWNYYGMPFQIGGNYLLIALALLLALDGGRAAMAASTALVTIAMATYESFAAVYVLCVFCILMLQAMQDRRYAGFSDLVKEGLRYAAVLVVGIVLKYGITVAILILRRQSYLSIGDTGIAWSSGNVLSVLRSMLTEWGENLRTGIYYLPIQEFLLAGVLSVILAVLFLRRYHGHGMLPIFLGLWISPFLLSILKGDVTPYRTEQTYAIFIAFVYTLTWSEILHACSGRDRMRWVAPAVSAALALLCFYQTLDLSRYFILNYQKSEEEADAVRNIGYELAQNYSGKPVIFVGRYRISEDITDAISGPNGQYVQTDVQSVLAWAKTSIRTLDMQTVFAYYGYDIEMWIPTGLNATEYYEIYDPIWEFAQENMSVYPEAGCYYDAGDYVIVRLGEED